MLMKRCIEYRVPVTEICFNTSYYGHKSLPLVLNYVL